MSQTEYGPQEITSFCLEVPPGFQRKTCPPRRLCDAPPQITVGQTFGDWCALSSEVLYKDGHRYIWVICSCAEPVLKLYDNLRAGKSTKCPKCSRRLGFLKGERHALQNRHCAMIERCCNPENRSYENYGARGIGVEEFLLSVDNYIAYIRGLPGYFPNESLHLDRIDNSVGYIRGNLRWVTAAENARNHRRNRNVVVAGVSYCFSDFLEKFTYLSNTGARNAMSQGVAVEDLPRVRPGRKSTFFHRVRSGELRPKEPFHDLGWLDLP
jgi:hypothetical protein